MVDKINKGPESEHEKSLDKINNENPFRFEKQELASLRLSIEEKRDRDHEKSTEIADKKEYATHTHIDKHSSHIAGLSPINQEGLQKRKESAQSVVTMVQDAKNDTGMVGVLGSWADRILYGIEV